MAILVVFWGIGVEALRWNHGYVCASARYDSVPLEAER